MSEIKYSGLGQYGAGPFEQQQFGTAGVEGVKGRIVCCCNLTEHIESEDNRFYSTCRILSIFSTNITLDAIFICLETKSNFVRLLFIFYS